MSGTDHDDVLIPLLNEVLEREQEYQEAQARYEEAVRACFKDEPWHGHALFVSSTEEFPEQVSLQYSPVVDQWRWYDWVCDAAGTPVNSADEAIEDFFKSKN